MLISINQYLKVIVICFVFVKTYNVEGVKILAVFPFPGPSQYILVQPYLEALAAKGHELTVINAFPQKQKIANFKDIPVLEVHDNYAVLNYSQFYEEHLNTRLKSLYDEMGFILKNFFIKGPNYKPIDILGRLQLPRNKWEEMSFLSDFFTNMSDTVLKNSNVQRLLKAEKFDLVILEAFQSDALYSLGRHFEAPMIGVSSFGADPIVDELMGNMSPFSYVPLVTAGLTERMSYKERIKNCILTLLELLHVRMVHIPRHEELLKTYMPHIKENIWELRTNFSLMLLNQHFTLSFPRPYVPSMVEVGGFQIHYKSKALPQEMENFINSSPEDIIYFSMGSNVKSTDFPPERIKMINDVFRSLPFKIMWKFENPNLPGKPDNVFISPWFPQPDVLAHPRVKLFISHGGLLSTTESLYHGKPMLCLPVFYDQQMNTKRAQDFGFAIALDFKTLPREEFKSGILEIMHNPEYMKNAKAISLRYHDQPMKPLDKAIYWTEYVLKHKGAVHLKNPAQKMSYIQKHSIDTIGVLISAVILIGLLVTLVLWKIVNMIFVKKIIKQKIN